VADNPEDSFWAWAWTLLAIATFLGGAGVFGYQVIFWLSNGEWLQVPNMRIWSALGGRYPMVGGEGIQKIISLLAECPASVTGIVISGISTHFATISRGQT
jgi:hypothetical protein